MKRRNVVNLVKYIAASGASEGGSKVENEKHAERTNERTITQPKKTKSNRKERRIRKAASSSYIGIHTSKCVRHFAICVCYIIQHSGTKR